MTGCGENSQATPAEVKEAASVKNSVTIQINGKHFSATRQSDCKKIVVRFKLPRAVLQRLHDRLQLHAPRQA